MNIKTSKQAEESAPGFSPELLDELLGGAKTAREWLGSSGVIESLNKEKFVPTFRLYALRHTHATLLLIAGTHPKIVSERLGHAIVTLTLDTYSHVLPGMQTDSAQKLDEMLFQAEPEVRAYN